MHLSAQIEIANAYELISDDLRSVKDAINLQFADSDDSTRPLLETFNKNGGKMIRPSLLLLAGRCCGKITDEHIQTAAIIEMIHDATLLHDDVIDEGQIRRGLETINSLWGNEAAVLLGDYILSRVFGMCASLDKKIIKIISDTTAKTCGGELRQVLQRYNWRLTESEYIEIVTLKTAMLFGCCGKIGAVLSKANKKEQEMLEQFGINTGIAFQITDDLLDIIGEERQTGKTGGNDVDKNKLTLPVIHLLTNTPENQKGEMIKKVMAAQDSKAAFAEILKSSGSLEYAFAKAKDYVSSGIEGLSNLKDSAAKEALTKTASFITDRVTL